MVVEGATARIAGAADVGASRGRLHAEPPSPGRSLFRRDCDRLIHAAAFRRLAYKTQVFVYHEGDHYRTRLTHTLEVTQIARSLARALGLDEDLAEACALGHDLGHPPFGHAGERALDRCLADHGGFDHNAQTLAVVTRLERRYPAFDGLNLTWETLEGLVKHNGPALRPDLPRPPIEILRYDALHHLDLGTYPSLEAQAGAIADDIAYDAHDIDDGLRADLFTLDDLTSVGFVARELHGLRAAHASMDRPRLIHGLQRRIITAMIEDVVVESRRRIALAAPRSSDDVRAAGHPLVAFSDAMAAEDRAIKAFLFERMYRHPRVMEVMRSAEGVLADLFARYTDDPTSLPAEWRHELPDEEGARARHVADFVAGMTDRYALGEHARLFDSTPRLR